MELTAGQRKNLREALISAFPKQPDLELMLEDELEEDLNRITQGEPNYELVVRSLIKWSEAQGRLTDLVIAASRKNPGNPTLRSFVGESLTVLLAFESDDLTVPCLDALTTLLLQLEDIEFIKACCRQTWSEVHIHRPQTLKDLENPNLSLSIKWLIVLKLWLQEYRHQPNGTPCILAFMDALMHHPSLPKPQYAALDRLFSNLQTELNYTFTTGADPATNLQIQSIKGVQGYFLITVQIPITEEEGSDRVFIKGFLAIKPDGPVSQTRLIPLQDLAVQDPADSSSGGEQGGITSTLKQLEQQFPQWVHQAEERLSAECVSLQQTHHLAHRPIYKLTIEFFLPYEHLTEAVDLWQVNRPVRRLKQMVAVGKKHQVVVRSSDRLQDNDLLNRLNQTWQWIELFLHNAPTDQAFKAKLATLDNLECSELDLLIQRFKQCLGLKLVCPLCTPESQEQRETIFAAVLEAGVPIVLWSRKHNLPNLPQELESLLVVEYLRNLERLLEQVYERRGRATTEDDLGYHLALLCDEPERLGQLSQFLRSGRLSA